MESSAVTFFVWQQDRLQELAKYEAPLEDSISTAWVTAVYLKHVAKITGKCYTIGNQGTTAHIYFLFTQENL